jgi:glycerol-3-phosphate acyltransferase PlsX
MGKAIKVMLETELTRNPLRKLGAALAYGGIRHIKRRMNPDNYGGAPLLGLNGTVIKAHGSARALAIKNAIRVATETIQHHIHDLITQEIARAKERLAMVKTPVHTAAA